MDANIKLFIYISTLPESLITLEISAKIETESKFLSICLVNTIFFWYFAHSFNENVQFMAMTVSKTRDMLVDVARQLFARMGVDNTTMNDIAQASRKGRRTLYTYFKSKNDIYQAVVETELNKLYEMLLEVAEKDLPADEKLMNFVYIRLSAVKKIVFRNGSLRANFFRDIWRVEKVRKEFDLKEMEIIKGILKTGVEENIFQVPDVDITAKILHHALKGLEVPYIRGQMGFTVSEKIRHRENIMNLIFNGIKIK